MNGNGIVEEKLPGSFHANIISGNLECSALTSLFVYIGLIHADDISQSNDALRKFVPKYVLRAKASGEK